MRWIKTCPPALAGALPFAVTPMCCFMTALEFATSPPGLCAPSSRGFRVGGMGAMCRLMALFHPRLRRSVHENLGTPALPSVEPKPERIRTLA